ncbi:glycoside hydrolase family 88 protein [Nonomuraea sp. NPDC050536]|uniref:glycoside hydrolase family 88 protein n=1 Tax=Nonomuraea sp. NPDC050536 TaxID=3364366 RepID=UPI0037C7F9BC
MELSRRGFLAAAALSLPIVARPAAAATLSRTQVIADTRRAADYWLSRPPMYGNDNNWQNATLHSGMMACYRLTQDPRYLAFTRGWAQAHDYQLMADVSSKPYNADHQAAAQVYLDLYALDAQPHYLEATMSRVTAQIASGSSQYWTWVDALHMGMPVYARLGYTDYLYASYTYTKSRVSRRLGLWDQQRRLWWRDANYVRTSTYWSRGNGWAVAALAKTLGAVPGQPDYTDTLRAMAAALVPLQRSDGFWNASLTDPINYAGPETSGTAFFTYGLAWGINHGLLDPTVYRPVVERAWQGLVTVALRSDGLLGYVQGPGARPSDHYPWSATDTDAFGVGAFLLAGSEVANL